MTCWSSPLRRFMETVEGTRCDVVHCGREILKVEPGRTYVFVTQVPKKMALEAVLLGGIIDFDTNMTEAGVVWSFSRDLIDTELLHKQGGVLN